MENLTNDPTNAIVTMQQHVMRPRGGGKPAYSGDFSWLLSAITLSTKIIAAAVRRAGLIDIMGATGDTNIQGETVQKLDIIANDTLKRTLGYRGNVGIVASEEDNDPRVIQEVGKGGKYIVMFDPLDGSSNIDTAVPVGTIFTILERIKGEKTVEHSVLQPGLKQLAAGYVLYGSSTVMVYTTGDGVHVFTLDPAIGAYVLCKENVKIPEYLNQYSVNEAYSHTFPEGYQKYLAWAKEKEGGTCSMRYIGSLVADFHRILLKGGVFLYPPTMKNPDGKLRLMYEANPLAMIAEQAGGLATDGNIRILEKQPTALHERTPLIIGGKKNVEQIHGFIKG